MESCAWLPPAS